MFFPRQFYIITHSHNNAETMYPFSHVGKPLEAEALHLSPQDKMIQNTLLFNVCPVSRAGTQWLIH